MPYCPNCGAEIANDAKFCGYCGGSVSQSASPVSSSEPVMPTYADPQSGAYSYQPGSQSAYQVPNRPTFAQSEVPQVNTTGLWIWSIVTTLISLIPGVIAMTMVSKINKCATVEEQQKKIRNAKIWCIVGDVIGILAIIGRTAQG